MQAGPLYSQRNALLFLSLTALIHAAGIAWAWVQPTIDNHIEPHVIAVSLYQRTAVADKKEIGKTKPTPPTALQARATQPRQDSRKNKEASRQPIADSMAATTKEIAPPQANLAHAGETTRDITPDSEVTAKEQTPSDSSASVEDKAETEASAGNLEPASAFSPTSHHLQLPVSEAGFLSNPKPDYPRLSRRFGEQGKVVLRLLILASGSVAKAEIETSSGYKRLDQAALEAIRNWRYLPAKQDGVAIEYWHRQPFLFELN